MGWFKEFRGPVNIAFWLLFKMIKKFCYYFLCDIYSFCINYFILLVHSLTVFVYITVCIDTCTAGKRVWTRFLKRENMRDEWGGEDRKDLHVYAYKNGLRDSPTPHPHHTLNSNSCNRCIFLLVIMRSKKWKN